jgi:hypothetical protein
MSAGTGTCAAAPNSHRRAALTLSGVVPATPHIQRATGQRFAGGLVLLMWGAFGMALYILVAGT